MGWIFSLNIVQSYLCCRPWKQRHLQLYQCQTLSEPPKTLIHKTDTMGVFFGLRSTKPENSRPRCAAMSGHKFLTSYGFLIQICTNLRIFFTKPMPPLDPSTSDLQDPKISSQDDNPRAFGNIVVNFTRHLTQPRAYMCHTCPSALWRHGWCLYDVTDHYGLTRVSRPTRFDPFILTRSEPLVKKKKKRKRKRKRKSFDQVELWLWPKSQNFQNWPVPLSFLSTFRFWDLFLHLKLRNCANCPIPKKLTFAQILTKKSKFSRSTYLAQFFA